MPFNLTTFDAALQAKLNTASVNLSAKDYLLLTKAVAAAIEVSEGISLLSLKGTANGVAGLDATGNVPLSQLLNAIPSQGANSGKFLTTNGTATSWASPYPSQSSNSGKILTTNGTDVSWTNTATLSSISATGDITSGDQLYVGPGAANFETSGNLTDVMAVFRKTGGANSFAQIAVQNATSTSSTDIIAYMDNGDDLEGWVGMGIAGSAFDDTTYGITAPGDGYVFHNTKSGGSRKGNLVIATGDSGTQNKLVFAAGGFASGDTQMEITPAATGVDGNIHIEIPTDSISPTTGALTVVGGVGISGDMNIAGDVSIQGTITFGGGGTTVETSNLSVTDPFVFVGTNNQADIVDLAFIGEYASSVSPIATTVNNKALTSNVATLTTSAAHNYLAGDVVTVTGVDATFNGTFNIIAVPTATTFTYAKTASNVTSAAVSPTGTATVNARRKFSGIARDASDGVIKAFKDATTKPTSTINFAEAGLTYADFRVGALTASSLTIGNVDSTEIGYLDGVTSSIQSQLNAKIDSTTVSSTYAPLASPSLTGTPVAPTAAVDTNTTQLATTAYVINQGYLKSATASSTYAPLASPSLTGTPVAPTAAVDTNTTQIATTAYVINQGYLKSATASSTYAPLSNASLVTPILQSPEEVVNVSGTGAGATMNIDLLTSSINLYTGNATSDFTFNFRGNASTQLNTALGVGQSMTVAMLVTNGSTAYKPNSVPVQIDGSNVTTRWSGGSAPSSGNTNSIDGYTFTIIKTGNATFTVLGAQTRFA